MGLFDQFYSRVRSLPQQIQALPSLIQQFRPPPAPQISLPHISVPQIHLPNIQNQFNQSRQRIQQAVSRASSSVRNAISQNQQQTRANLAARPKINYPQVIQQAKQTVVRAVQHNQQQTRQKLNNGSKFHYPTPVRSVLNSAEKTVSEAPLGQLLQGNLKGAGQSLKRSLANVGSSLTDPQHPENAALLFYGGKEGGIAEGLKPQVESSVAKTINPQLFVTHLEKEGIPAKVGHILDVAKAEIPEYARGLINRSRVEEIKQQIKSGVPINPPLLDEAGKMLDGANHLQALKELGIKGVQTVTQKSRVLPTEASTVTSHSPITPPSIPGGTVPSDPVKKVISALKEAQPVRAEQEAMYTKARGERLAKVIGVRGQQQGEQGFYKELGQLKGELPKAQYESIRPQVTQQDVDSLFNKVTTSPHITEWEKINAQTGLAKILSHEGGTVPTKSELKLLNDVFGSEFTKTVLSKRSNLSKIYDTVKDVANIPRALQSSIDFSAALRQGVFAAPAHPIRFGQAFVGQFKQAFSEKAFQEAQAAIKQRPTYNLMKEHGLAVDTGSTLGPQEEAFASSLAEKIPLIGGLVRGSERGYVGFLNKFRADIFDDMLKNNPEVAQNPRFAKDAADLINNMTGRGNLPSKLEGASQLANSIFFSPKLIMSRINLLNPLYYAKLQPAVRKEAIKSLLGFAATGTSLLALAKAGGADVVTDPRNADFGKIKVGNTRIDPWGGFQQYVRLAAQFMTGHSISSTTGKDITVNEGYKPLTRDETIGRFVRGKTSPVVAFAWDLIHGSTLTGEKLDFKTLDPTKNRAAQLVLPLMIGDIKDAMDEWGAKGALATIPGIFGMGTQTYGGTPTSLGEAEQKGTLDLYKYLKNSDKNEANNYLNNLQQTDPTKFNKISKYKAIEDAGLGQQEFNMLDAGVKDGTRAQQITTVLNQLHNKEEKNNYIDKLYDLGIMTDEVFNQLVKLKQAGKLVDAGGQSLTNTFIPQAQAAESVPRNAPENYKPFHQTVVQAAEKNGIPSSILAAALARESANFDPRYVNGYHVDKTGRGIAGIDKKYHPEVSDQQAFDPNFSINWMANELGNILKRNGGNVYNALREYNGGSNYAANTRGYQGRRKSDLTKRHADTIYQMSEQYK